MTDQTNQGPAKRDLLQLLSLLRAEGEGTPEFDPWKAADTWTFHERFRAVYTDDWDGSILRKPSAQVAAVLRCRQLRSDAEEGEGAAILEAVFECAVHGLVMPGWLAAAFSERYRAVVTGECRSWSDVNAFGDAYPKGANVAGIRAHAIDAPWAYEVAVQLLQEDPNVPLDQYFYQRVGDVIGRSHSTVHQRITEYVDYSGGEHPPLTYVRSALLSGAQWSSIPRSWRIKQVGERLRQISTSRNDAARKGESME